MTIEDLYELYKKFQSGLSNKTIKPIKANQLLIILELLKSKVDDTMDLLEVWGNTIQIGFNEELLKNLTQEEWFTLFKCANLYDTNYDCELASCLIDGHEQNLKEALKENGNDKITHITFEI